MRGRLCQRRIGTLHRLSTIDLPSVTAADQRANWWAERDYDFWTRRQADGYRRDDREVIGTKCVRDPYVEEQVMRDGTHTVLMTVKAPLMLESDERPAALLGVYADISEHFASTEKGWRENVSRRLRQTVDEITRKWNGERRDLISFRK